MADLSDADKKALLGADYKRVEAERDASRGVNDQTRLAKSKDDTAANIISIAIGLGILAFVIGLANFYSRGTPYNAGLVIGCTIVVIASAAIATWFMMQRKAAATKSS